MMNFRPEATRWAVTLNIGLNGNPLSPLALIAFTQVVANHYSSLSGWVLPDHLRVIPDLNFLSARGLSSDGKGNPEQTVVIQFDAFTQKGKDGFKYGLERSLEHLARLMGQKAIAYQAYDTSETATASKVEGFGGPNKDQWVFNPAFFINHLGVDSVAVKPQAA